ncbi:MAG: hypothetical protein R3C02_05370 [Planctomycetaceae bacterium]
MPFPKILMAQFLFIGIVGTSAAHADLTLTGASLFNTNATGDWGNIDIWNTVGSDPHWNVYFTAPNSGSSGAFVNTGNGASTSLNLTLAPGTYVLSFIGQSATARDYYGMNLFFEGSSVPAISVFGAANTATSPPYPAFQANSSTYTYGLTGIVAGAGTLSFQSGTTRATLTDYRWSMPNVSLLDRVQPFANTPNGVNDNVGFFTLDVTSVPEPAAILLTGMFLLVCLWTYLRALTVAPNQMRSVPPAP